MRLAFVASRAAADAIVAALLLGGCAHSGTQPERAEPEPTPTAGVVTAEDIRQNPSQSIEQLIRSKCASCAVTVTPDGRITIRIRGQGTITGSSEPLYVIDGVPIDPGPSGALSGINPYDIETIAVLTEPTAITMYGSRGANGVIVITTKQAPRRP